MKIFLNRYYILVLCILGSLVRLLYGLEFHPWYYAPDHLAWDLVIDQNNWSYDQLIHYPHEGGSVLISLLARMVNPISSVSALTIIALLLDVTIRYFQIKVVNHIFGKQIALLFAFWTILASPILIPWASVNFGLHYLSGVFPFLLLALIYQYKEHRKSNLILGTFVGLSIWFSYANVVLVPALVAMMVFKKIRLKSILEISGILLLILSVHALVRVYADPGFQLNHFALDTVRGESFSLSTIQLTSILSDVPSAFVNALTALPSDNLGLKPIKTIITILIITGLAGYFIRRRQSSESDTLKIAFIIIVTYLSLYVIGPFYYTEDAGSFVLFRHLTYIAPLAALLILKGTHKIKSVLSICFIVVTAMNSMYLFDAEKAPANDMVPKATGWVLGVKFGHDPDMITDIAEDNSDMSNLLMEGVAWGTCSSLFTGVTSSEALKDKTDQLLNLMHRYPQKYHVSFYSGILLAFSDQVTPRLPKDHLKFINAELAERAEQSEID